ncbi:T9SS type A sorting domain-containing protein [Pedobacter sp.]
MKQLIGILFFTCANAMAFAQVNFVKNPSFEDTVKCIDEINQIGRAKYWTCAVDTVGEPYYAPEYYSAACGPLSMYLSIPENVRFYQYPHTGNAIVAAVLYYDRTPPPPGGLFDTWRDYFQGRFHRSLEAGKTYCISFWVTFADYQAHAHDKIGAYVDNGKINDRDTPGNQILDVIPQVYTTTIQKDTQNWTRIEGTFVATGNETHITLGNFFPNADVAVIKNIYGNSGQYSYYLFDDVAVIPIDLKAEAGKDSHAEPGKPVQIGRVGDTTAMGLDCKWYNKGMLIDSGAVISVNGAAIVGKVDTYVVVQTICGLSKNDTVTVTTVPLGFQDKEADRELSIFPNPTSGKLTILSPQSRSIWTMKVYDLMGRLCDNRNLSFPDGSASVELDLSKGVYFIEFRGDEGSSWHERIIIE